MVKESIIGMGILGIIAYLFIRNKGGNNVLTNSIIEKVAAPEIKIPEIIGSDVAKPVAIEPVSIIPNIIKQLQNKLSTQQTQLETLRTNIPGVIAEVYEPLFNWRGEQFATQVINDREIEQSLVIHRAHLGRIQEKNAETEAIKSDIRQLQI